MDAQSFWMCAVLLVVVFLALKLMSYAVGKDDGGFFSVIISVLGFCTLLAFFGLLGLMAYSMLTGVTFTVVL